MRVHREFSGIESPLRQLGVEVESAAEEADRGN
jgi:hypothetical protein